jgi:hypothetical protein
VKSLRIIFIFILVFSGIPAFGNESKKFPCGGSATYSVSLPAGVATDGKQCSGNLVIDGSVKVIGVEAFKGAKLRAITLPDSLELISNGAFQNTEITQVQIPNKVEIIGESAFADNYFLSEAVIPNSVKSIGAFAFNSSRLKKITIPISVTKIENCSFANMGSGGSISLVIPSSVTSILGCAFWNSGITDITLPSSLEVLEGFSRNKISTLVVPNAVKRIGVAAFSNNPLISLQIPESVVAIDEYAFVNTYLSDVVLPDSLKTIKSEAFANNLRLKTISIPDGIEDFAADILKGSTSLQAIYYCGKIGGLPITPVCPPERQAIIDAKKAAAELKAKQEAEAKAAAEKAAAELKAKQEAEAKAAAEKAAAELKAKQEAEAAAKAKAEAAKKKFTITCVKGKLTKKVTAVKPKCPAGYKLKK